MMRKSIGACLLLFTLFFATGCQMTQAAFPRTAGNAGAAFAAAAVTLTYVHEKKISPAYASSSFVNYQEELSGLPQTLSTQSGAPDAHTLKRLFALSNRAMQAINAPCLSDTCDWQAQIADLNSASKALLEVSGS